MSSHDAMVTAAAVATCWSFINRNALVALLHYGKIMAKARTRRARRRRHVPPRPNTQVSAWVVTLAREQAHRRCANLYKK